MTPEGIDALVRQTASEWERAITRWQQRERIVLIDEAHELLCRAVCAWAGVPLAEAEVRRRTAELVLLIEAGGRVGPRHWQGRLARSRAERWAGMLVRRVRSGALQVGRETALARIAGYVEPDGRPLPERVAAVELLNILRPTVAIARYVVFVALALQSHGDSRAKLVTGEHAPRWFVHEVRRFYPFFPFVTARVRRDFEWNDYRFEAGTRTLLDLYGTNRDPRLWSRPERFDPERFRDWDGDPYSLMPQGAGDPYTGHRCAGEWITIELMELALDQLSRGIRYDVAPQDLRVDLSRMPTQPNSGFVISNVVRLR